MKPRNRDFPKDAVAYAVELAVLAVLGAAPGLAAAQQAAAPAAQDDMAAKEQAAKQLAAEIIAINKEGDPQSLTCPENFVELGGMVSSRGEPKFGEYNGLSRSGGYGVGKFSLSGGDGYCQKAGSTRWQVFGNNLATTSRDFGANIGQQGQWSVGFNYDQLRHYTTTGFQTPYQGGGGNMLTLPSNFGVINTGVNGGSRALTAAQLAAFQNLDVYNERQNSALNASYALTNEWNVKFNYKHIDRSGAKLIGGGTDTTNMTDLGGFSFAGQGSGLKINPTKDRTELITLQLNWVGDKAYATLEYFGSLYHDDYRGLSFENPFVTGAPATGDLSPLGLPLNTMSTPPSNMLNQLNLTGGYFFSKATRLTGGLSLGLNTQNSSYDGTYTPGTVTGLPVSSLHGRVINTHADARLTHQFSPALNLNTGFRFDQRNNVTAVNQYEFTHLGGGTGNRPVNTPESYRRTVFDAALDYRINKNQKLHFGYGYDHMQRWCHNDAANNAQGVPPAADAGYYVNASCVQVPRSTDNSLNAAYRLALSDAVNLKADYTYADRDATVNASFYNPMQAFNQGFENYGWLAFFQAPRREHTLKLRTGWQITNQFDVGLTGTYTYDNYYDSAMGVQNGHAGNINLDATYQMSSDASIGSYIGWQRRSRYLLSASNRSATTPDPLLLWNNELHDDDFSFGVNAKQKFLHGKFQLTEDLSYDYGKSRYNTGLITTAEAVGNSGPVPPIKNQTIQFRVTGSYQFSKTSRINVGYAFQRLISNDYLNNGYMYGYTPSTMIPANMQSSSYKNHVFFVTYRYTF